MPCLWAQLGGICRPFWVHQQNTSNCRKHWYLQDPTAPGKFLRHITELSDARQLSVVFFTRRSQIPKHFFWRQVFSTWRIAAQPLRTFVTAWARVRAATSYTWMLACGLLNSDHNNITYFLSREFCRTLASFWVPRLFLADTFNKCLLDETCWGMECDVSDCYCLPKSMLARMHPPKQEQSSIVNFQVLYTFILHVV